MAYTKEEKRAIAQAARELQKSGKDLAGFHPTSIEGHPYSHYNACMIITQNPHATILGGFHQWRAAGRQVRKGETGIVIWRPVSGKSQPDDDSSDDDSPATGRKRFVLIPVFDVSQTDEIEATAQAPAPTQAAPAPRAALSFEEVFA